ncbi:TonB-dependent receptor [Sphingomonas bisphenolicum]
MKISIANLLATTALLAPVAAYAQDSGTNVAKGGQQQASTAYAGSDIIVTATKRSERLQDVPVSIAVVTPDVLTGAGVVSTTQLGTLVPGLSFGDLGQPKLTQFVVRGVGTLALSVTLEPSVGVAVDGVPLSRIDGALTDMVDIERVEVLKGPQGMLFGKNATAGLISIVTKKPVFGENSFIGHTSYGSYDENNTDATVNLSMGESGAVRLTAWRYAHDGFVRASLPRNDRDYYDKNTYGTRLSVSVRPIEDLQVTLIGQFDGRDENGVMDTDRKFAVAPAGLPGTEANPRLVSYKTSIGIVPSSRNFVADISFPGYTKGENFAVTGLVDWELGNGFVLSSATSFRSVDSKSSLDTFNSSAPSLHIEKIDLVDKYTQFSEELRIASDPTKRLSFVAGLFYSDFEIRDVTEVGLTGFPFPFSRGGYTNLTENFMKNYAAFGEARFEVIPGARLIGGVRQSHDRTGGYFSRLPDSGPQVATLPSFARLIFKPKTITYDFTSYRFGAQADVARDVMLYATTSRGYKAPGFNLTANLTPGDLLTDGQPNNALVDAETVRSYEAGIKSQFFDRRLTLNITAFHSVFSNFQTTVTPANSPSFVIRNAGELKSTGAELELSARPIDGLSLGLNGAYLHARYTDYTNANCYLGQPDGGPLPASGVPGPGLCYGRGRGPLGVQGGIQSLNGFTLPLSPKWSFNARARYDAGLMDGWRGHIGSEFSFRGKTQFENNDPNMVQKAYGITNFNIGFGPDNGRWEIAGYIRNAFDKHYVARVREALGIYKNIHSYDARRRIGVQFEIKY